MVQKKSLMLILPSVLLHFSNFLENINNTKLPFPQNHTIPNFLNPINSIRRLLRIPSSLSNAYKSKKSTKNDPKHKNYPLFLT